MNVGDIRKVLESGSKTYKSTVDQTVLIFRPTCYQSFIEVDYKMALAAFDEIVKKIPLVEAGIDSFTATEKLMFQLFEQHAWSC